MLPRPRTGASPRGIRPLAGLLRCAVRSAGCAGDSEWGNPFAGELGNPLLSHGTHGAAKHTAHRTHCCVCAACATHAEVTVCCAQEEHRPVRRRRTAKLCRRRRECRDARARAVCSRRCRGRWLRSARRGARDAAIGRAPDGRGRGGGARRRDSAALARPPDRRGICTHSLRALTVDAQRAPPRPLEMRPRCIQAQ